MSLTYAEKLQDPRWQKKRLEVMKMAAFKCADCGADDKPLHVHHRAYARGKEPWDYDDDNFVCVCRDCHGERERVAAFSRAIFQAIPPGIAHAFLSKLSQYQYLEEKMPELIVYMAFDQDTITKANTAVNV